MVGLLILFVTAIGLLLAILTALLAREMRRPSRHTAGYAVAKGMPCDPGDVGLDYEEWTLDRPDGAHLPVWDIALNCEPPRPRGGFERTEECGRIRGEDAAARAPLTLVFVHGWGHSRIDSLTRIAPFRNICDRFILYDLRGHGDSTGSLSTLGDGEDDDLIALLERLGPDQTCVLAGHSMGAVIALAATAKLRSMNHPIANRIAGIIAWSPYCEFHASLLGRLHAAGYPGRPITDFALLAHRLCGITPLSLHEAMLGAIRCPILILHGSDDEIAPISHGRRIAHTTQASLIEIPSAGHQDAHAVDPERTDREVRQFIERCAAFTTARA